MAFLHPSWEILGLYALASFVFLTLGSHEFVNNVPDGRCERMGQFLSHPQDRCKYVVCEFGSGKGGYSKGKMYARVMRCAPGSSVPYVKYKQGQHKLIGTPCTEHYGGKCPARLPVAYGSYSRSSRYSRPQHYHSRYRGYPGKSLNRRQQDYHRSHKEPLRGGRSGNALVEAKSIEYFGNTPDGRCQKVGQFWTHPHDRCKYIVCEFGRNTLTASVVYSSDKLYARVMRCAPGTTVAYAKYAKSTRNGLKSNPCTEYYGGRCPARVPAYHPLY